MAKCPICAGEGYYYASYANQMDYKLTECDCRYTKERYDNLNRKLIVQRRRLKELLKIIEPLPHTIDGVILVPDMKVYLLKEEYVVGKMEEGHWQGNVFAFRKMNEFEYEEEVHKENNTLPSYHLPVTDGILVNALECTASPGLKDKMDDIKEKSPEEKNAEKQKEIRQKIHEVAQKERLSL